MEFSEYINKCIFEFDKSYWKYYLILERDVRNIEPYISFERDNYYCFSNEFIKLYQAICSEIDVFCKRYCEYIHHKSINEKLNINGYIQKKIKTPNINHYAEYIEEYKKISKLNKQKLYMLESECEFIPWENWRKDNSPEWWKKYNAIKHNRAEHNNYKNANLFNVLNSLAGLNILEKYFYKDLIEEITLPGKTPYFLLEPESKVFCKFDFENNPLNSINF